MKSLKSILKEVDSERFGPDKNWSVSAAELAKKAQDPQFIAQLKQHVPQAGTKLVAIITNLVPDASLAALSDADFHSFLKALGRSLDTKRAAELEKKSEPSEPSGVAAIGKPEKTTS